MENEQISSEQCGSCNFFDFKENDEEWLKIHEWYLGQCTKEASEDYLHNVRYCCKPACEHFKRKQDENRTTD
jgi:hypothetical protein